MSAPPNSVLDRAPTNFAHRESGAFVVPNGTTGPRLPLPSNLTGDIGFNAHYVRGKTGADHYGSGPTVVNGRVTYHLAQRTSGWQPGDTCEGEVTIARRVSPGFLASTTNMRQVSYEMWGITEFLRRMKHDSSWRRMYGSKLHVADVKKTFTLYGIQQTTASEIIRPGNTPNTEVNFITEGRARVWNVWLASAMSQYAGVGATIGEHDCLYFVWQRHRYDGNDAFSSLQWNDKPAGVRTTKKTIDVDPATRRPRPWGKETEAERAARKIPQASMLPMEFAPVPTMEDVDMITVDPDHDLDKKKKPEDDEYYWTLVPWVSRNKAPPPNALYCGEGGDPYNQYMGDHEYIGQVIHVSRGPNDRTTEQVDLARQALYSDVRSVQYQVALHKLDEVAVHVGIGAVLF